MDTMAVFKTIHFILQETLMNDSKRLETTNESHAQGGDYSSEKCLLNTQEALGLLQSITQTKCGT